jgi:hypothetical protein
MGLAMVGCAVAARDPVRFKGDVGFGLLTQ